MSNSNLQVAVTKTRQPGTLPANGEYGFGRYFSDHMFSVDYEVERGWYDLRITPYAPIPMDPGASVLHYGQALFEGMKAYRGDDNKIRLFRPEMNYKRMCDGAERLCMQMPSLDIFLQGLDSIVRTDHSWIPNQPGTALYLRPTLIGTEGFLGVRPSNQYLFYVIASPVGGYYGEGIGCVKIWVEQKYSRAARGGIGAVKAGGNYASSLRAAFDSKKQGYAQVLWLDAAEKKYVEEVGTMNVFFKIGAEVITPALSGSILPGVTRDSVIQLLKSAGVKITERPISISEVRDAHKNGQLKEIFGTGTAASISPVGQLGFADEIITIGSGEAGPMANHLFATLNNIQYGRIKDEFGWTQIVSI